MLLGPKTPGHKRLKSGWCGSHIVLVGKRQWVQHTRKEESMFFVPLLCLLLIPGCTAVMTSPLYKLAQWNVPKMTNYAPSDDSVHERQPRSLKIPDVTHLEILVVVGPDVQTVHKQDTERYILTNLNIASELLRDFTLGANMRVHLVRMIILTEPEPEIQMSSNITSSLRSVCDWGKKIHPPNDTNPLHADLLLYITRYDLVLPDGNRQVRGVAQLGGVCTADWSCVITEDTGFDLGITVAHEIGHSFGLNHDGVGNSCSRSGFIMASDGGYNSVDLTWSSCSRQQLLTFFSNGKADCVKDLPVLGDSLQNWKPGLYYGVDDQCQIAFGKNARACTFSNPDFPPCRVLSCHVHSNTSSCKRLLVPLLDGTECGPNQWCLKGSCVSPEELGSSVVVHGAWSSWSDFSPCSRTCGGGISHRTRQCNNPKPAFGGHQCVGVDVQAELCHQNTCERSQLDFMAEQCALTDHQPLYLQPNTATFYTWTPAIGVAKGNDQCRLLCQSEGENFIVNRGSQFVDGTRCELDSQIPFGSTAACLKGKCQIFGCDGVLRSENVFDECGVCGGNGSSCTLTSGYFNAGLAKKYVTFLSLPMNATQVHIINRAPLFTHMAVLVEGQYAVSGKGSMALNVTHPSLLDDHQIQYRLHLTPDLLPMTEELLLPGPIQQEIHIQVYRKYGKEYGEKTNPNITYKLYVSAHNRSSVISLSKGKWIDFVTPCSASCGSGVQKREYMCVDPDTKEELKPQHCDGPVPSEPVYTTCQQSLCPPRWKTGEFGSCGLLCGGGERVREVRCVQEHGDKLLTLPDSECLDRVPSAVEKCNMHHCPARWHVSEAGKCSAVCGPGEAKRDVFCVRAEGGLDVRVNESMCMKENQPLDTVPCVVNVCQVGWENEEEHPSMAKVGLMPRSRPASVFVWSPVSSQCSKACGNGTQQVWFSCVDHQTRLGVSDFHCQASTKPQPYTEICNTSPCPPMWRTKQGVCSVTCGGGVAKRVLYCAVEREREEVVVDDAECQDFSKPKSVVACNTHSCPARWKISHILACSVSCGLGVAHRTVLCVQFLNGKESVVPDDSCHGALKPAITVPCLVQVCTFRWEVKPWTECSVTCGYGIQSRTIVCVGPSNPEAVSPLLCMHMPKPITIQGCNVGCLNKPSAAVVNPTAISSTVTLSVLANHTAGPLPSSNMSLKEISHHRTGFVHSTEAITVPVITPNASAPTLNVCGRLMLDETGTLDLTNATGRCVVSVGRPLDEVIHIKVESSFLNCSKREYVAFFDRLSVVRKCEQVAGSAFTTRTNVVLIRQNLLKKGNGVVLNYWCQKNMKKSRNQDCDIQLFAPTGTFENPATMNTNRTCKVLINAPPSVKIKIRAIHIGFNATISQSTYIMIRDMDVLKTHVFKGQQLFEWLSTGNMAEVEFHGDYLCSKGAFKAEYSFIKS